MGKLYDLIKKQYEEIKAYSEEEKNDFVKSKVFPKTYPDFLNKEYINLLLHEININAEKYFGSKDNFNNFLKNNADCFKDKDPFKIPSIENYNHITNLVCEYDEILKRMEIEIGEEKAQEICDDFNKLISERTNINHPFENDINNIKNEIDKIYNDKTIEERNKIKEDLDFLNQVLIEKKYSDNFEHMIDDVSETIPYAAKKNIDAFSIANGLDSNKMRGYISDFTNRLEIPVNSNEQVEYTKNVGLNYVKVSDDLKNKILGLNELIKELGVPSKFLSGEQSTKTYGLIDYFNAGKELSRIVASYKEKNNIEEKRLLLDEIGEKRKNFEEIESKYQRIFDYIEKNFDVNNIMLNGNIYSGRKIEFKPEDAKDFLPNLPEKWDNEKAPYTVILNGFCQLMGEANKSGVTLEEYIDKPVESYLKLGFKYSEDLAKEVYLDKNNPLGKRLAHSFVMSFTAFTRLAGVDYENRGLEFLNNSEKIGDNTFSNYVGTVIGSGFYKLFDRSAKNMFLNDGEPSFDSIRNIYAMDDKTDKLYELSENYYDEKINKGSKFNYEEAVLSRKDLNAKDEMNKIMTSFKDYVIERNQMFENAVDNPLNEEINLAQLIAGAKKYYDDFIVMNKKDIFNYNSNDKKAILKFLKDPAGEFANKYKKELGFSNADVNEIKEAYKRENAKINAKYVRDFENKFSSHNQKENGYNVGKNITRILKDNSGGFLEWLGRSTSPQYKALKDSVENALNPESPNYGNMKNCKFFAIKYVEHKLPEGVKFEDLKPIEKKRIEFCMSIIETADEVLNENIIHDNNNNNIVNNNIIDNNEFHNQLNKDTINLENNIDDNQIDNDIEIKKEEIEP